MQERVERPIDIPAEKPVTAAEIARRKRIIAKTLALREEIGPIQVSVTDLIRQVRDEHEPIG